MRVWGGLGWVGRLNIRSPEGLVAGVGQNVDREVEDGPVSACEAGGKMSPF